jgi:hypothetical protein
MIVILYEDIDCKFRSFHIRRLNGGKSAGVEPHLRVFFRSVAVAACRNLTSPSINHLACCCFVTAPPNLNYNCRGHWNYESMKP